MDTLIWGGAGQAKVIRPIIEADGHHVVAVHDQNPDLAPPFDGIPIISGEAALAALFARYETQPLAFAVAIGGQRGGERVSVGDALKQRGATPLTLLHERAWVAESAQLGEGCQVLAMAAISEQAELGRYCIINTGASVDHECRLGDGVHVMPGAVLAGCVEIGDNVTVGSNATLLPRVRIGPGAVIGAGAVVTEDIAAGLTVAGAPARPLGG